MNKLKEDTNNIWSQLQENTISWMNSENQFSIEIEFSKYLEILNKTQTEMILEMKNSEI